jgi:hypothetical protein
MHSTLPRHTLADSITQPLQTLIPLEQPYVRTYFESNRNYRFWSYGLPRATRVNRLRGSTKHGFTELTKVNTRWPNPSLMIALHSPNSLLETGLHMCPAEKSRETIQSCSLLLSLDSVLGLDWRFHLYHCRTGLVYGAWLCGATMEAAGQSLGDCGNRGACRFYGGP